MKDQSDQYVLDTSYIERPEGCELADFHTHSTASDGTFTPSENVALAAKRGLKAIAVTDHDTVGGVAEALAAGKEQGVEVIAGIEFSCAWEGLDIHIVGLDLDLGNEELMKQISTCRDARENRNQMMIDRMADDGIDISREQMIAEFGDMKWTRAHFARHLISKGVVQSVAEAFDGLLDDNGKYFIPRSSVRPDEMVNLIFRTGGIPVMAHPFQYRLPDPDLMRLVTLLKENGLSGIEAFYSTHTPEQTAQVKEIADRMELCISGGSDFHGKNKPLIDLSTGWGDLRIPYELITIMREKRKNL